MSVFKMMISWARVTLLCWRGGGGGPCKRWWRGMGSSGLPNIHPQLWAGGDSHTVTSQHITANTAQYITGLSKVTVRSWGQRINIIARNLQYAMQWLVCLQSDLTTTHDTLQWFIQCLFHFINIISQSYIRSRFPYWSFISTLKKFPMVCLCVFNDVCNKNIYVEDIRRFSFDILARQSIRFQLKRNIKMKLSQIFWKFKFSSDILESLKVTFEDFTAH